MSFQKTQKINPKKKYLQVALNSTLTEATSIIKKLPKSDRVLIEAGTPLIKQFGYDAIAKIREVSDSYLSYEDSETGEIIYPYVVADLKTMDRAEREIEIASSAGADAAIALGHAPIETLGSFVSSCKNVGMDSMIDMMNVEYPLSVLDHLKEKPTVVILHRGVDEEKLNKDKQIPLHEIRRIKSRYDIMISIAGGDTVREAQRAIFNDADIVVIWKSVFQSSGDTAKLVEEFLKEIR